MIFIRLRLFINLGPPNITTSQETNIKCKRLKLIGNVSLYDDSPDILEVFWTKNGEKIDSRGSGGRLSEVTIDNPSLIIRDVNVDDAGNYQLTAVNAVGSTTSNVITLGIYINIYIMHRIKLCLMKGDLQVNERRLKVVNVDKSTIKSKYSHRFKFSNFTIFEQKICFKNCFNSKIINAQS